jgi:hypothetical protein
MSDEDRLVVYYTALLVNVGCHSDAHEQAKWFGDDITLKSSKYTYDMRSVRGALPACALSAQGIRRCTASGSGWSSRCVGTATWTQ